ncbi:MAG TPA: hypothetical protein VFY29_11905 [Terriglobia bacterium]|nr:hypothetical protein [Terriglobia bacterium]
MWLDAIPENLREQAAAKIAHGDVVGFLAAASNQHALDLVYWNADHLMRLGVYERALVEAFTAQRTNNHRWPLHELSWMFSRGDLGRLRAAGDPLPGPGPFTLYRGVAGHGNARRVRGLSWTDDRAKARWFAARLKLADPAVFAVTIEESAVVAYVDDREEREFIVLLPENTRPKRLR